MPTLAMLSLQISVPAVLQLPFALALRRRRHDGIAGRCPDLCLCPQYLLFVLFDNFEGRCMPMNRYLQCCTQAMPHAQRSTHSSYSARLALHLIASNPLTGSLSTEISIAHLSVLRPFSILSC